MSMHSHVIDYEVTVRVCFMNPHYLGKGGYEKNLNKIQGLFCVVATESHVHYNNIIISVSLVWRLFCAVCYVFVILSVHSH